MQTSFAAALLLLCSVASGIACAGDAKPSATRLAALGAAKRMTAETVHFGDPAQPPVRVLRGGGRAVVAAAVMAAAAAAASPAGPPPAPAPNATVRTETVSFGAQAARQVTVIRGGAGREADPAKAPPAAAETRVETISFADPAQPPVRVVRGFAQPVFSGITGPLLTTDLFGAADSGELDRIAFAVDGLESRHGADPGMWRLEADGPQGPMQVSAAAALDVGGGDRFDLYQNRLLGRAYLAQMYRRYGNWADALGAYNWGPGNLDQWIAAGRPVDRMPPGVAGYIERALRNAFGQRNTAGL